MNQRADDLDTGGLDAAQFWKEVAALNAQCKARGHDYLDTWDHWRLFFKAAIDNRVILAADLKHAGGDVSKWPAMGTNSHPAVRMKGNVLNHSFLRYLILEQYRRVRMARVADPNLSPWQYANMQNLRIDNDVAERRRQEKAQIEADAKRRKAETSRGRRGRTTEEEGETLSLAD